MTEKLYYKDAYIKEFTARVISSVPFKDGYDTVLDRTAFFPEEGGQYSDKGRIADARVLDVREKDGVIHHYTDRELSPGEDVACALDFDERYEKMQCHTAEHILSGIIHSLFGLDNVGFHLGADEVTMDVSAPLSRSQLDRVEELANEAVFKNIPVECSFPREDEIPSLAFRAKADSYEDLRVVKIGEVDACACCAPHVNSTGEIGLIKILDFASLRGGIRIRITAGRRAVRYVSMLYKSAEEISGMLSVPKSDISGAVRKLLSDHTALKAEFSSYKTADMTRRAEALEYDENDRLFIFDAASVADMIAFSNAAISKCGGMLILLSGKDGDYKYVISSLHTDLRAKAPEINKSLLGRGGGKPNMIQGSFAATADEIRRYFNL